MGLTFGHNINMSIVYIIILQYNKLLLIIYIVHVRVHILVQNNIIINYN